MGLRSKEPREWESDFTGRIFSCHCSTTHNKIQTWFESDAKRANLCETTKTGSFFYLLKIGEVKKASLGCEGEKHTVVSLVQNVLVGNSMLELLGWGIVIELVLSSSSQYDLTVFWREKSSPLRQLTDNLLIRYVSLFFVDTSIIRIEEYWYLGFRPTESVLGLPDQKKQVSKRSGNKKRGTNWSNKTRLFPSGRRDTGEDRTRNLRRQNRFRRTEQSAAGSLSMPDARNRKCNGRVISSERKSVKAHCCSGHSHERKRMELVTSARWMKKNRLEECSFLARFPSPGLRDGPLRKHELDIVKRLETQTWFFAFFERI